MNNNTIKGTGKEIAGKVESAYGNITGNKATEAKGEAKRIAGKLQRKVGQVEDAIED